MNQPWICPRCQTVNAPHVNQCTCVPGAQSNVYVIPDPTWTPITPTPPTWPWRPVKVWWGDPPWDNGVVTWNYTGRITISDGTTITTYPIGDN